MRKLNCHYGMTTPPLRLLTSQLLMIAMFFYIGNNFYSFGPIQAKIIRELYKAAQSPNPWVLGKNLLADSGARTQHLKDLFKSHPILPLIKYKTKGYYSLLI